MYGPAKELTGLKLNNKWQVVKLADKAPKATGGHFSTGYIGEGPNNMPVFIKAMDYVESLKSPFPMAALYGMTQAYMFEKSISDKCRTHGADRVLHPLDSGSLTLKAGDPLSVVEFLVYDLAEGDIRSQLDRAAAFDLAFVLRAVHSVAVGIEQLHKINVAHQDLKPSNVLQFAKEGSKLTDFGRAWASDIPSPYDDVTFAGDRTYQPPELMYGEVSGNKKAYRFGTDLYLLGNLIVFLFTRVNMTTLIVEGLSPDHRPSKFAGKYAEVLPYVKDSYSRALARINDLIDDKVRDVIMTAIKWLCEPDPAQRGHPDNRQGMPAEFSLERIMSYFDMLATRAESNFFQKR